MLTVELCVVRRDATDEAEVAFANIPNKAVGTEADDLPMLIQER